MGDTLLEVKDLSVAFPTIRSLNAKQHGLWLDDFLRPITDKFVSLLLYYSA